MTSFDIVALAKRIGQRREEWNRLHPDAPVRVSSVMSRILENDPDYIPYRPRAGKKRHRASRNPSVRTLAAIADVLGTTVGDLLGEPFILAPTDRAMVAEGVRAIREFLQQIDPDEQAR
jgi:hypothetical protein